MNLGQGIVLFGEVYEIGLQDDRSDNTIASLPRLDWPLFIAAVMNSCQCIQSFACDTGLVCTSKLCEHTCYDTEGHCPSYGTRYNTGSRRDKTRKYVFTLKIYGNDGAHLLSCR